MQHFYAIVHKDEGSAYGVEFPDLPGCYSAADDLDDVPRNAREALSLWFEDQEEVAASSLDDIRAGAEDALASGAFLIAVPHIARKGKLVRANISMDQSVLDAIDEAAKQRKQTRSAFLADAAMLAMDAA